MGDRLTISTEGNIQNYRNLFLFPFILFLFFFLANPLYGQKTNIELPANYVGNLVYLHPITPSNDTLNILTSSLGTYSSIRYSEKQMNSENKKSYRSKDVVTLNSKFALLNKKNIHPIHSIINLNRFTSKVWTFDFTNQKLIYHPTFQANQPENSKNYIPFNKIIKRNNKKSIPNIKVTVDGDSLNFLIDTGATLFLKKLVHQTLDDGQPQIRGTSYISRSLFEEWHFEHPDWLIYEDVEEFHSSNMIKVPTVKINNQKVGPVWFTTRPDNYYSKMNPSLKTQHIVGSVGGSFLKYFKVTINYTKEYTLFKKAVFK